MIQIGHSVTKKNALNLLQNTYICTLYCFQAALFQNRRIQPANRTLQILCHTLPRITAQSTV